MTSQATNVVDFSQFRPHGLSNESFLRAIFGTEWERAHVCAFREDPTQLDALGLRHLWAGGPAWSVLGGFDPGENQYFTISLFKTDPGTGRARRKKGLHEATYCVVMDDVGSSGTAKVPWDRIKLKPSWVLETSPGNYQVGYILLIPDTRAGKASGLLDALVASGLCSGGKDPGMKGVTRYVRLPGGTNTKSVYGPGGFKHRLVWWEPGWTATLEDIADAYGVRAELDMAPDELGGGVGTRGPLDPGEDFWLDVLGRAGLVRGELSAGIWDIECPFIDEHTQRADSGCAYLSPGGFKCHHGSCQGRVSEDFQTKVRADHEASWKDARRDEIGRVFADIGGADDPFEGLRLGVGEQAARAVAERVVGDEITLSQAARASLVDEDDWLLYGLMEREGYGAMYGPPGAGKSFVAVDLACHLGVGMGSWHGFEIDKPGFVYYVSSEGGIRQARKRLKAWSAWHGGQTSDRVIFWAGSLMGLAPEVTGACETLRERIRVKEKELGDKCRMVVVDTLNQNMTGDENSATDMGVFNRAMSSLKKDLGCFVMVVHHSGKDAARGLRGSTALHGAVDLVLRVTRGDGDGDEDPAANAPGEIWVEKSRADRNNFGFGFKLEGVILGTDRKNREIRSCVAVPSAPPIKRTKLGSLEKELYDFFFDQVAGDSGTVVDPWDIIRDFSTDRKAKGDARATPSRFERTMRSLLKKNWIDGSMDENTGETSLKT